MSDDLADRLDALEHAVADDPVEHVDGGAETADLSGEAARSENVHRLERRVTDLEATVEELEATAEELEAAVQAVRGYAGNVRAVNRDVERRASAALAKAEALESAVGSSSTDTLESSRAPGEGPSQDPDLSREPTVIADNRDSTDNTDNTDSGDTSDPDDHRSAPEGGDDTDADTDRFIQRVRDAI